MTTAVGSFLDDVARLLTSEPGLITLGLGLVVSVVGFLWRVYVNRKRLAYKVEFNSKIGIVPPFASDVRRRAESDQAQILNAFNTFSLLVIRVQNTGRVPIEVDDYTRSPTVVLTPSEQDDRQEERYIVDFRVTSSRTPAVAQTINKRLVNRWAVSERRSPMGEKEQETWLHRPTLRRRLWRALVLDLSGSAGVLTSHERDARKDGTADDDHPINPASRRQLTLDPPPALKPGDEFDLVLCLRSDDLHSRAGAPPKGCRVLVGLRGSSKVVNRNALVRRPSGTAVWAGVVAVLALLLAGSLLSTGEASVCADGELRAVGSSAFAPSFERIAERYGAECSDATITTDAGGSLEGLRELAQLTPEESAEVVAFSDGSAPGEPGNLQRRAVAVLIYSVVVNRAAGVTDLTAEQLRQIDDGVVTNWAQLGGANLPISIVGRGPDSGSRQAYERYVLGRQEAPVSSNSCLELDRVPPATGVAIRCERPSTTALLDEVERVPGAVGYADASPAAAYQDLVRVRLDEQEPTQEFVGQGYQFWTIEYAYTNGVPPNGELLDRLVGYLSDDAAARVLREDGYVPCVRADQSVEPLCLQDK